MEQDQRHNQLKEFQALLEDIFGQIRTKYHFFPKTKYNLSGGHIFILTHLYRVKTCTASDIAKKLGITSGGGTVLTDNLLKHNLISRQRSTEDRRVVELSLTAEGKKLVDKIIENRTNTIGELLHDLEEAEMVEMLHAFRKFNNKMK